jgi:hypothetical protein
MSTPPAPGGGPTGVRRLELAGVTWTVREVRPASATSRDRAPVLVFDSGMEQRQLDPAPPGWLLWTELQLQDACLRAVTWQHLGVDFRDTARGRRA